jgi:transposase
MPVINHMRAHLRCADRIFVDETRAPVLDPGRKATKSGFFWAVVTDDRGHGGAGAGQHSMAKAIGNAVFSRIDQ